MRPRIALAHGRYSYLLLTRPWDGNDEFTVFLGNEVFAGAGRAAVGIFLHDFDIELFGWFECQANFAASG